MLGSTGLVVGTTSSGEGGSSAHEGGETAVGTSSIMSGGIGADDEKSRGASGGSGDYFEGDRSTGGNRWPRQETIALLKIRSDMDVVFRDSSLKGPLWEEVSRKMAELGYHRSSKKCKEKFENVYKYHKRTKDGRVGKSDGKNYRFFEQLEALEQHHASTAAGHLPPLPPVKPRSQSQLQPPVQAAVPVTMVIPAGTNPASVTVTSSPHPISVVHTSGITTPHQQVQQHMNANHMPQQHPHVQGPPQPHVIHQHHQPMPVHHSSPIQMENASSPSATPSSSSSTSSDEELLGRRKRKRKWKEFFEKLMKEVIDKQEHLQKRFLEAVEKREHDRLAREEAWKLQEMARLNREHDILVQERSMAAAKDAALVAFLQKLSDQQQIPLPLPVQTPVRGAAVPVVASATPTTTQQQPQPQLQAQPPPQVIQPQPQPQPHPQVNLVHVQESSPVPLPIQPIQPQPITPAQPITQMPPQPQHQQAMLAANTHNANMVDLHKTNNGDNQLQAGSSRWPKAEVQALIDLRTKLDQKYQENGPKGPLWEEISSAMRKLGYNRNAKRCKEKWENINKYFKKVKESNKKRPEDSKTCPYFHQLDALYREKNKMDISNPSSYSPSTGNTTSYVQPMKPENLNTMGPIMAQQPSEQQWQHQAEPEHGVEEESDNEDDSEEGDEEDDDDQGSGYEIVANNNNNAGNSGGSMNTSATTTTATVE